VSAVLILTVIVLVVIWFFPRKPPTHADILPAGTVKHYRAILRPLTPKCDVFKLTEEAEVTEEVIPPQGAVPQPNPRTASLKRDRKVKPRVKGWFVSEIQFAPFDPDAYTNTELFGDPDAFGKLVYDLKTQAVVELHNLPEGLFCQAMDAKPEINPYQQVENVNWQLRSLDPERGVAFLFVHPPFNGQRWWVNYFLLVGSWPAFLAALFGFCLTAIPTLAKEGAKAGVGAVVKDWWSKRTKDVTAAPPPPPAPQATPPPNPISLPQATPAVPPTVQGNPTSDTSTNPPPGQGIPPKSQGSS
jgi:hypothetical protein